MNCLIKGARVVEPHRVRRVDILIEDGVIARIGRVGSARNVRVIRTDGLMALPGFIDIHSHGAAGLDMTDGLFDAHTGKFNSSDASWRQGIPKAMKRLAHEGVTRVLLATAAAPLGHLERALELAAEYVASPRNGADGARLVGTNLEGTFISNPKHAGAQNPREFVAPTRAAYERLQRAAHGTLRYVNCVPEYGRAAVELTRHMTRQGVLVGAGHSFCDAEQADKCRRAGLRVCVHLLNGRSGTSFKSFGGGNMVEFFLTRPDMYVELICDGWHVAPGYALDVIARKGLDHVVLVTDAMFIKGTKGVREFTISGRRGRLGPRGKYIRIADSPAGSLFGSTLAMPDAFSNVLSWLTSRRQGVWLKGRRPMPLEEALVGVARASSSNAAHLLGLDRKTTGIPGAGTGELAEGKCADIALGKLSGRPGEYHFNVKYTIVAGKIVAEC